ncbi:seryl-tRNA synthetase [Bradyrhizobium sp. GM22.5]
MTQSDWPPSEPQKTASQKPTALGGVQAERRKRKAAEAKLLAADETNALLQQRVNDLEHQNRELTGKLQAALTRAARSETALDAEKNPQSLAALGLHYEKHSGTISGTPKIDGAAPFWPARSR